MILSGVSSKHSIYILYRHQDRELDYMDYLFAKQNLMLSHTNAIKFTQKKHNIQD